MDELLNEKPVETPPEYDQVKLQMLLQEIKDNQSLLKGILGGIGAAAVGAAIWAVITALTNYQIGWMAVGVGFLVGFSVRQFGKGIDQSFGIAGALLSLIGCLTGNLLAVCIAVSRHQNIPLFNLLLHLDFENIVYFMKETFNPIDLLFYGIAVYEGFKFSFYKVSSAELAKAKNT